MKLMEENMQIDKSNFEAMPAELRALFYAVPNPARDEVLAAFPDGVGANGGNGSFAQHAWMGGDTRQHIERSKGSAARFFYCAKASKTDRGADNVHPTVKPTDLMRYLCRLVTPPGGTVLDPFTGSGSTGKAARLEGFGFIGFELSEEYTRIATARIAGVSAP